MTQSDQDLLKAVRGRDPAAFDVLLLRYREPVRRHLLRTVRDKDAAHDLVQEVFLRVWTHADQWDGRGAFRAWLFRIATNLALNLVRTQRRRREQPLEPTSGGLAGEDLQAPGWMVDSCTLGPEQALEQAERYELLQRLIAGLSEEKREVIRLVHEADLDIAEVAHVLGVPPGTVRSRLHYARRRLADQWKQTTEEMEGK